MDEGKEEEPDEGRHPGVEGRAGIYGRKKVLYSDITIAKHLMVKER